MPRLNPVPGRAVRNSSMLLPVAVAAALALGACGKKEQAPAAPAAASQQRPPEVGVVTVQPGGNLWTIARLHLGSGVRYTQIFTANRDLIRDPDLIYPGQHLTPPAPIIHDRSPTHDRPVHP